MTASQQVLLGGGGGLVVNQTPWVIVAANAATTPFQSGCSMQYRSIGGIFGGFTAGTSLTYTPGSDQWYDGTTDGSFWWIKFTLTAGTTPTIGTLAVWQSLTTDRSIGWNPAAGAKTTCTYTMQISSTGNDAGIIVTCANNILTRGGP